MRAWRRPPAARRDGEAAWRPARPARATGNRGARVVRPVASRRGRDCAVCPRLRERRHRARSPGSRAHDAPDANRTSAARSGMARPSAPRTRPNSPSPIGVPRASTAARAATCHAVRPRPAVSLEALRESRHDGEGLDRSRRTIVRRRSRRPSCARRTVRRVARTKGRDRDRQVTPSERRMQRP